MKILHWKKGLCTNHPVTYFTDNIWAHCPSKVVTHKRITISSLSNIITSSPNIQNTTAVKKANSPRHARQYSPVSRRTVEKLPTTNLSKSKRLQTKSPTTPDQITRWKTVTPNTLEDDEYNPALTSLTACGHPLYCITLI